MKKIEKFQGCLLGGAIGDFSLLFVFYCKNEYLVI